MVPSLGHISGNSLSFSQLNFNPTTIEDGVDVLEDPNSLDDTFGKDFDQTIQSEISINADCTTRVCTQAGVPLRRKQKNVLGLE